MITFSLLLAAAAALNTTAAPKAGDGFGSISGHFMWEGEKPAPKPDLPVDEKAATGCKHPAEGMDKKDDSLLIDEKGGVANIVVTLSVDGVERKVPTEPIVIDQMGCRFHPHVVVVPIGGTLRFANSDDTNHNIHTYPKKNDAMNKQVAALSNLDVKYDKAEVIEVKCDVHTWMKSYAFVTDATFWATTAKDGSFKLEGVPAGDYELTWWHEDLGKGKTEKVHVEAGKDATVEQKVGAEKKAGGGRRR